MARIKRTARQGPSGIILAPRLPTRVVKENSRCLQLMGFPKFVDDTIGKIIQRPNWAAVMDRMQSHPNEAAPSTELPYECPLFAALSIESDDPLPSDVAEALVRYHPEPVTNPRSKVMSLACKNPRTRPEVIDVFLRANPTHLCGRERTRTFQIMGFPAARDTPDYVIGAGGRRSCINHWRTYEVDWEALEEQLAAHPEEAKIVNPEWSLDSIKQLFPLEAALCFRKNPVPLTTVQLLLRLCPEAATISDSCALYMACVGRSQEDAEVIRTILHASPNMATSTNYHIDITIGELGLPITEAVHLPCAEQILPDLVRAAPESLASENQLGETPLQVVSHKNFPLCTTNLLRLLLEEGHRHGVGANAQGQLLSPGEYSETTAMDEFFDKAMMLREDWESGRDDTSWTNLCLCLKAAGAFRTGMSADDMWSYPLLQGAIEFGRNRVAFEQIFSKSTHDDVIRRDMMGRTPLRVAIELAGNLPENDDRREGMCIGTVIEMLLDDHQGGSSESASVPTDPNGTLPLHYALKHGIELEDGLRHIVKAFSGALSIPDPQTKLIPCLLSAVGGRARVGTIFSLMVDGPHFILDLIIATLNNDI